MLPTREEAEELLKEAEVCNPGPWSSHSRIAAHCAERIAEECGDIDPDKAYIVGLLHDIGRKFGTRHLGHVFDGYHYMMSLGYDEAARICLTHSFNNMKLEDYVGKIDTSDEEYKIIKEALNSISQDEYDRLIQLCDSLAGAEGVMDIEDRMADVKRRYGSYPQEKWDININRKKYYEEKMKRDIYNVVKEDSFIISEVKEAEEKRTIVRQTLEALTDWFGVPESREEYIKCSTDQICIAAYSGARPVGFLCLKETGKDTVEIAVMGVLMEYHRKGIGRRLFKLCKQISQKKGYSFMQVKTVKMGMYEDYDRTNRFYLSLGFKELEVFPTLWDEMNPCQIYVMSLM